MKHCEFCKATFASESAYQIHLGVGAPAFHSCNDATEMLEKGMTQNQADEWDIAEAAEMYYCKYCGNYHPAAAKEWFCPLNPNSPM